MTNYVALANTYLIKGLSKYPHKLRKIDLSGNDDGVEAEMSEANCITSRIDDALGYHTVMVDLDVPARLIPSSTPGHYHLYIDVPVTEAEHSAILRVLSYCRIVQPGYADAFDRRHFATLRFPWVHKEEGDLSS